MRYRVWALGAFALFFLAVPRAGADEPKKYDLTRRDRWQPGDVRTLTESETVRQTVVVNQGETVVQKQETKTEVQSTVVQKVLEANDGGRITKSRLHVKEWRRKEGDEEEDTSLKGALLEVTGLGKERSWKMLSPTTSPSTGARAWLDEEYGSTTKDDEAGEKAMMPKAPLAIGETWEGDTGPLADLLAEQMPVDREKAKLTGKLLAVEDGVARISVEVTLPLTGFPIGGGTVPFSEGGDVRIVFEATHALEGRVAPSTVKGTHGLKGVAEHGGMVFALTVEAEGDKRTTIGGEVPEPPAPPVK